MAGPAELTIRSAHDAAFQHRKSNTPVQSKAFLPRSAPGITTEPPVEAPCVQNELQYQKGTKDVRKSQAIGNSAPPSTHGQGVSGDVQGPVAGRGLVSGCHERSE